MCALAPEEVADDGDGGAAEIYAISAEVGSFVTTEVARAVVDMNRARDDRRADGVTKTHTCWNVGVWHRPLSQAEVDGLLDAYHAPYHQQLTELGQSGRWALGVDCHTMAATGPPLGPDPGRERPWVCLSNGDGTCPQEWIDGLRDAFKQQLDGLRDAFKQQLDGLRDAFKQQLDVPVKVNDPFRGGYITRSHSTEMPWIQIELSRAPYLSNNAKRQMVLTALQHWTSRYA